MKIKDNVVERKITLLQKFNLEKLIIIKMDEALIIIISTTQNWEWVSKISVLDKDWEAANRGITLITSKEINTTKKNVFKTTGLRLKRFKIIVGLE